MIYSYDGGGLIGPLSSVSYQGNANSFTYDAFGRITGSTQTTNGQPFNFSYTHSLTDQLTSETYPSGRKFCWLRPVTANLTPAGTPLLRTLSGHSETLNCTEVLPDGRRAISGGTEGRLAKEAAMGRPMRRQFQPVVRRSSVAGAKKLVPILQRSIRREHV